MHITFRSDARADVSVTNERTEKPTHRLVPIEQVAEQAAQFWVRVLACRDVPKSFGTQEQIILTFELSQSPRDLRNRLIQLTAKVFNLLFWTVNMFNSQLDGVVSSTLGPTSVRRPPNSICGVVGCTDWMPHHQHTSEEKKEEVADLEGVD